MSQGKTIFSNSILKDRIEVLENSHDQLIFRTFLEANGGQNQLHYHTKLNETFTVIEGQLHLIVDNTEKVLCKEASYTVHAGTRHMFTNNSSKPVVFDVHISNPRQMIHALQLFYGLANDGRTTAKGLPKNLFHIAIGLKMMNTFSPKVPYFIQNIGILFLAFLGKLLGIEKSLIAKYRN